MSVLTDYKSNFFKQVNPRSEMAVQAKENDLDVTDIHHSMKLLILTGHNNCKVLVCLLMS